MKIASWLNWRTTFRVRPSRFADADRHGSVRRRDRRRSRQPTPEQIAVVGQTQAIGAALFTEFLLPFELTSVSSWWAAGSGRARPALA